MNTDLHGWERFFPMLGKNWAGGSLSSSSQGRPGWGKLSGGQVGAGVAVHFENFFGGFEVAFAGFGEDAGALVCDEFGGDLFDFGRAAFGDRFDTIGFFDAAQGIQESSTG